ncbi:hypothetical protein HOP50_01g06410 [Chloropicon primus]|uniref:Uncharacterized protein n=1 Tax=Chloropicon primus TaxID=1764295 RepID=A0A5B8MCA7_9CHLO|nr:hypothetical protein A3770_01p06560 [Chloropicon primus]UPQ97350.1 hypothetical protein HOP50_01g06410 [Chloropicon primus]|eukprot:QDZ18138.1 hypothetical protein A3770_01p06560 [Chloropicon primus]
METKDEARLKSSIMALFDQTFLLKRGEVRRRLGPQVSSSRRGCEVPAGSEFYCEEAKDEWHVEDGSSPLPQPRDILRKIYTREHTEASRASGRKLVQKCRHCLACRGIPAPPQGPAALLKDKVLDMMTISSSSSSSIQAPDAAPVVLVPVRRGPVPSSRWRSSESLGSETSTLLEKRSKGQLLALRLPERYTNIASLRISAPSDMCMEKYSFVGTRAALKAKAVAKPEPHIIRAEEVVCQHGRYLQTVYEVTSAECIAKSKSTKHSPQSVLVSIRSSGTSSTSSSGRFEGFHPTTAKAPAPAETRTKQKKQKKKKSGFGLLSSFLNQCIMSGGDEEDALCGAA